MSATVFETIRVREGWAPLLSRHAARLDRACRTLGLPALDRPLDQVVSPWLGDVDQVIRVQVGSGGASVQPREMPPSGPLDIVVTDVAHAPYPCKVTARARFDAALAAATARGADDALLVTVDGLVAEGTRWSIFWWEADRLATPPLRLGILPGIARARVMDLVETVERECRPADLATASMFATNAVRGIMPIRSLNGVTLPADPRLDRLTIRFWPDSSRFGGTYEMDTGRSQPER